MSIHLRKIEPSDLPFLYQWENDASVWADGSNHNPLSKYDLRQYIESSSGNIYCDGQLRLIAEDYDESIGSTVTIGCADLFDLDIRNRRAAIGLYIAPDFRGSGKANEVLCQLEEYAFSHLHLRTLYAVISTRNTACSTLFEHHHYTPSSPLPQWTLEGDAIIWVGNNRRNAGASNT